MKPIAKFLQLFIDDNFLLRLKEQLTSPLKELSFEQTEADIYFDKKDQFFHSHCFIVNSNCIAKYSEYLAKLSVFNNIIFVIRDEQELLENIDYLKLFHWLKYNYTSDELLLLFEKMDLSNEQNIVSSANQKDIFEALWSLSTTESTSSKHLFIKDLKGNYFLYNNHFANSYANLQTNKNIPLRNVDLWDTQTSALLEELDYLILSSGKGIINQVVELILKSGQTQKCIISKMPLKDGNGKTWFITGAITTKESSHEDEEKLFPDWKLLQILMDNIPDSIYFKDLESRFIRINRAQAKLIGIESPEEAIGKTDFDFFNIELAKKTMADEQRIINTSMPINGVEFVGTKDGRFRWVSTSKVPITDKNGKVIGTVGITHDIDKMMRVEQRLKSERDMLQLLIDHIPSPIYFKDTQSKFTRVNLAQAKLLGANSPEDVIGKSDFDYYTPENADEFYNDEKNIIDKHKPLINKVEECFHPGDGLHWFSTTKIPLKNEDGELSGIVGVSHDITDQILIKKNLELAKEKAEIANSAKSNFLSNMSHEIRTPMNGVIGMAEVLNMTDLDEEQKRIVDLIIRSGNNLLNIINDILDLSKIESEKLIIEAVPIDIKSIVREVHEMFYFVAIEKKINFVCKIDSNIPESVIGDSLRLKQVLINLTSNALKFTQEGEIVLEASFLGNNDKNHCVIFKVNDTGIGIGKEQKQYLFEAFTQADASTSRKYGGTGLGLAICSRLVKMMGGKLDVISELGTGSTFFFDICFKKIFIDDLDAI